MKRVPIFGTIFYFWVPIYLSWSLFSVFWVNLKEECQFSLHVYSYEKTAIDHDLVFTILSFLYGPYYGLHICRDELCVTLLASFNFYPFLRVKLQLWVPIEWLQPKNLRSTSSSSKTGLCNCMWMIISTRECRGREEANGNYASNQILCPANGFIFNWKSYLMVLIKSIRSIQIYPFNWNYLMSFRFPYSGAGNIHWNWS